MLYICILSNKFDLKQTIRVLHSFITLAPGPNVLKLFMYIIFIIARVFVLGKLFQASLMAVSKVQAYLCEVSFRCSTLGKAPGLTKKH